MKVLVVDDDWAVADVVSLTMRRAGFEVIVAHDGEQAVEFWASEKPNLIILDLNLPKRSGLSVLKHIRSVDSTPVIILSVRDSQEDIDRCREEGANGYFIKPFSPRELLSKVKTSIHQGPKDKEPEPNQYLKSRCCISEKNEP